MDELYLNCAAQSFPKPDTVLRAAAQALSAPPVEPGRTFGKVDPMSACRSAAAELFGVGDPNRVVLLPSATEALNLALAGLLFRSGHAVTSDTAHNSVLRPLFHAARDRGATLTLAESGPDGRLSPDVLRAEIRPDTALIAVCHMSNVTGVLQPIEEVADIAAANRIPLVIDAAQSAGLVPLSVDNLPGRIYVAFSGHKGPAGPSGTGGLIVPDNVLPQLIVGGTGILSESCFHPTKLPLCYEAGTPNLPGFAGLEAGIRWVIDAGPARLAAHRDKMVRSLRSRLFDIPGMHLSPLPDDDGRGGIVSFSLDGRLPEQVGYVLYESFGIVTRAGLHCAPLIHRRIGSAPHGTVRASVGPSNTEEDMERLAEAVRAIAAE